MRQKKKLGTAEKEFQDNRTKRTAEELTVTDAECGNIKKKKRQGDNEKGRDRDKKGNNKSVYLIKQKALTSKHITDTYLAPSESVEGMYLGKERQEKVTKQSNLQKHTIGQSNPRRLQEIWQKGLTRTSTLAGRKKDTISQDN
ncbi:hypothetical protein RUM44_011584 [Polyplax serrata]|uniref:Uncharacterized protein n=1 Tax=Polyplax serrata TaxID=468196 RepID=A0ABR1ARY5_POLSC